MRHLICVESSHSKGMGHLFRGMNLARELSRHGDDVIIALNRDERSEEVLARNGMRFAAVDLLENEAWEEKIISEYGPSCWIDDRLDTGRPHAERIKRAGVKFATFDDHGSGAEIADINILAFDLAPAKRAANGLYGPDYMILNPAVAAHRRTRKFSRPYGLLVTLGGSDTYGVTPRVLKALIGLADGFEVTAVVGPGFVHESELAAAVAMQKRPVNVLRSVPDLIALMAASDIVVCGGGVTLFEAAALGLPALTIANEPHETPTCEWFEKKGTGIFLGFYAGPFEEGLAGRIMELAGNPERLGGMSAAGKTAVDGRGLERVAAAIREKLG